MAREGINYPGWFNQAACSVRCQLARLWSAVGSKVAKINTIQPDGDGKINVVSDTANLIVTDDPSNNAIRLDLDAGLQAPPVTSVNGATGAVVLDAGDISDTFAIYNGSSLLTTNTDTAGAVSALAAGAKIGDDNLRADITAEATARGNADSALQTNINNITASLPGTVASAVAADPTVTQLATDVPNKVDKITGGSVLRAYTHTGATQGDTLVKDGTDANSIGIRDANGRMQAADPASGATDKTLITANWASQTGDTSPNNLLHRSGNESKQGRLDSYIGNYGNTFNIRNINLDITNHTGTTVFVSGLRDKNDVGIANLRFVVINGHAILQAEIRNDDGTYKYVFLAEGDP